MVFVNKSLIIVNRVFMVFLVIMFYIFNYLNFFDEFMDWFISNLFYGKDFEIVKVLRVS